ncbi:U-box domain containing 5 S homeolog [Xenopus laevis]|uniref:LOC495687 protein n=1 Tax=Xenopus laevis TaxID=8355 RepID=Q5U251_XENLA|nr:U-box domain containing 5 S homeolog [Xenopus laevis]AAH86279.1 LOC495687 protein [Xenopus laevis]
MVINLCLPQFRPRVVCNKISADGYEVENLISEDPSKRNRGFRCEYFIRPPVHVTITFPCTVEICRINIDTSHGGQHHFSGIDLYTSLSSTRSSWNTPDPNQPVLVGHGPDKELFNLVGKVLLKNQSKATFNNRAFKPRHPFNQFDRVPTYHGSSCQDLWNKGPSSLASVTSLKICITHIAGGAPCCIKRVEVWGQPAKTCPKEIVESLYQIACLSLPHDSGQQQPPSLPMESSHMSSGTSENIQRSPSELASILHNVPEEFLDPITLDIMTFPMLLPSGKVIDQSTLDKCNQSEATWGRLPSDPFTGVPFSQHSQPVAHPSLKVRIDYFLLQHRVPGSNILGRTQIGPFVTPSAVALSSMKRKIEWMEDSANDGDNVDTYFSAVSGFNSSASDFSAKKLKTENDCSPSNMDCSTSNSDTASHEKRLTQSLDYALTTTLGSMPSYTARFMKVHQLGASGENGGGSSTWSTIPESNRCSEGQGCSSCGRIFSAYCKTEPVYQLSCGHLMCRPCLAEKQKSLSVLCNNCNRTVATRDVQRVHL